MSVDYDLLAEGDVANADLIEDAAAPVGPYAAAADIYRAAGWAAPLPVFERDDDRRPIEAPAKKNPPAGYTGYTGVDPSSADIETWKAFSGWANIALRLSDGQLGLDADAYDGRKGAETIARLIAEHGPPPPTWSSTSRGPGQPSRINCYRVPSGDDYPNEIKPDVDIVRRAHRYVMAWPSVHPDTGEVYEWYDPDGNRSDRPPRPEELAWLPDAWVEALHKLATEGGGHDKADINYDQAKAWMDKVRDDRDIEPCDKVTEAVAKFHADDGGRHPAARTASSSLISLARYGHNGTRQALDEIRKAWTVEVRKPGKGQRTEREAIYEWRKLCTDWIAAMVLEAPEPRARCRCGMAGDVVEVITAARKFLHLPDPTHLLVSMAVAATSGDSGEPVWLMIVAPPSSGKTETIKALDDVARAKLNDVTTAGLISYKSGKNAKVTGILPAIGEVPSLITISDLSSLLASSDRGGRDTTFSTLREVYDGFTSRAIGSAPEPLTWSGRITAIAAVTGVIDRYAAHADALGPRWVYIRLPDATTESKRKASRMARRGGLQGARDELRERVTHVVEAARKRLPDDLPDDVEDAIEDAALVTSWGRAAVPRNGYGRREIDGLPTIEDIGRLTHQLRGVARGLVAIGLDVDDVPHVIRRVALDSMPADRRVVLEVLATGELLSTSGVAKAGAMHRHVARMRLEELEAIGVVTSTRKGAEPEGEDDRDLRPAQWHLNGADGRVVAGVVNAAIDGGGWHEMWVPPTPPPQKRETTTQGPPTLRATPEPATPAENRPPCPACTGTGAQHRGCVA